MSWPYPPEPALATDRFTMIVSALVGYIRTKAKPGTLWSQVYLAAARVTRLQRRFERLVVRYRAGTLVPPRPRAPRPEKAVPETEAQETGAQKTGAPAADGQQTAAQPAKPARPASLLPRHHGWLCAMVPLWAAGYGGKILYLLDHPEMRELIAAAPQAGRLLRPLLWMTGRYTPAFLALPKRVRAPRTKREDAPRPRLRATVAPGAADAPGALTAAIDTMVADAAPQPLPPQPPPPQPLPPQPPPPSQSTRAPATRGPATPELRTGLPPGAGRIIFRD